MTARVWCLGDAVVDLLPDGPGHLIQCAGGAPANVAVGIARLQGKSGFIGRVGDDPFGHFMQQTLASEQVETAYMTLDSAHRTSTVVVALDHEGERSLPSWSGPAQTCFLNKAICRRFSRASGFTAVPLRWPPNRPVPRPLRRCSG